MPVASSKHKVDLKKIKTGQKNIPSQAKFILSKEDIEMIFDESDLSMGQKIRRNLLNVLPQCGNDIERLANLMKEDRIPVVTVIGKYNHGKSRLLNELIGSDVFKVADKRQTMELEAFVSKGASWLDAPGLDADVASEDDRKAWQGAWLESDIRLFVHAAKEGELDAKERDLLNELHANDLLTQRKTIFVLSQIDQLASDDDLERVKSVIVAQCPHTVIHEVSSVRYRQGMDAEKHLLVEKSGIPSLQGVINDALSQVKSAREREASHLRGELATKLKSLQEEKVKFLTDIQSKRIRLLDDFESGLRATLEKVELQLRGI